MLECEQMPGLNMIEHGASVHEYYTDLHDHIILGHDLRHEWMVPDWAKDQTLWSKTADRDTIMEYQLFHDCGKPFCRQVDDEGKQHFPDHANVSADTYRMFANNATVEHLIRNDMAVHLLRPDTVESFCKLENAPTLLLTGLAELHSNAKMFGGIESTGFKIKYKRLNKLGKRCAELIK